MSLRLVGSLAGGALLGKLLGFAREIEMARLLGASVFADSFRGALTGVLLPVAPLQSDMLPSVLIPLHRSWREAGDPAPRSACLALLLTCIATAAAVLVWVFAAPWVGVLVARFDADAQALTVRFVHVMALAIPASVLSACLGAIEIATGRSRINTIRASVQNVSMMAGIALMALAHEPLALPWSFVAGFGLIAAYGLVVLGRERAITLRGVGRAMLGDVARVFLRRFSPLLAIPLADQGNILLERMLASGVAVGALASLDYARTLTDSAFYLVSLPIGYVVLTRAARPDTTRADILRIAQCLLGVGLPASAFIAVFADDIVRIVFMRGAFDGHAVALTAGALRGISVGLWASTLGWVLIRMVNAGSRNRAAAAIVVAAYGANAAVNMGLASSLGMLGLGLGEAARGIVLLGGTAAALGCTRLILGCIGPAFLLAAALGCAGLAVCATIDGSLARLALATPIFGAAVLAWLALHLPDETRRATGLLRPRLATLGWTR